LKGLKKKKGVKEGAPSKVKKEREKKTPTGVVVKEVEEEWKEHNKYEKEAWRR